MMLVAALACVSLATAAEAEAPATTAEDIANEGKSQGQKYIFWLPFSIFHNASTYFFSPLHLFLS